MCVHSAAPPRFRARLPGGLVGAGDRQPAHHNAVVHVDYMLQIRSLAAVVRIIGAVALRGWPTAGVLLFCCHGGVPGDRDSPDHVERRAEIQSSGCKVLRFAAAALVRMVDVSVNSGTGPAPGGECQQSCYRQGNESGAG